MTWANKNPIPKIIRIVAVTILNSGTELQLEEIANDYVARFTFFSDNLDNDVAVEKSDKMMNLHIVQKKTPRRLSLGQ
ncbi:hypothetical protein Glove_174g175 [Diversispora epigaea]|uniref:Uncharacterized protein n=1 Tax=Diversispora epigaea TaxID=1348612 RepID=A0A397IRU0_9GLOM|nr:hypothetical protein Glove_174g175 [Diversispora epigaea]